MFQQTIVILAVLSPASSSKVLHFTSSASTYTSNKMPPCRPPFPRPVIVDQTLYDARKSATNSGSQHISGANARRILARHGLAIVAYWPIPTSLPHNTEPEPVRPHHSTAPVSCHPPPPPGRIPSPSAGERLRVGRWGGGSLGGRLSRQLICCRPEPVGPSRERSAVFTGAAADSD